MELLWVRYASSGQSKYLLLLELGRRNGKLCALLSEDVTTQDAAAIRKMPAGLSLEERIGWVKRYCPRSYKSGYREIYENRIDIVDRYKVGG